MYLRIVLFSVFLCGCFSINLSGQTTKGDAVELPPLSVEDSQYMRPWRYASIPGVEVLSRCDDDVTIQLIEQNRRLHLLLAQIIPESLQIRHANPVVYILYSEREKPVLSREIITDMEHAKDPGSNAGPEEGRDVSVMPNFRFWDRGSLAVFFVLPMVNTPQSLSPGYVRDLIEKRTPRLPRWFIEGMTELYGKTALKTKPITAGLMNSINSRMGIVNDEVVIDPFIWVSEKETALIKESPKMRRELLPMTAIFSGRPPRLRSDVRVMPRFNNRAEEKPGGQYARTLDDGTVQLTPFAVKETADPASPSYDQIWQSQSALFIRWALEGKDFSRRAALWKLVERASHEAVTEVMFKECFGLDYEQMETELRTYLPAAVKRSLTIPLPYVSLEPIEMRDPTQTEISRIKGKLDRLEIGYIKAHYPQLTGRYVAQARKTLRRAYDQRSRDPQLLAELGLCECDGGDDAAAEPFLREAANARAIEPRVYFELARITYNRARTQKPEAKLTPAQTADLIALLFDARRQAPPLPETYDLIAMVWARSTEIPTIHQLAVLDEGIRNFPDHIDLIYLTAKLQIDCGYAAPAKVLIDLGLVLAAEPDKIYFEQLKTSLEAHQGG